MRSFRLTLTVAATLTFAALACGDIKSADPSGGPGNADAASEAAFDAAPDAAPDAPPPDPARSGPGPHGSLPSGYCCNDDRECRYRRCVDTGGAAGKMCLDECFQQIFCTRPDITFTCALPDGGGRGLCRPPSGFACIPAGKFTRGVSPIGACCNASDPSSADGTAGSNCEGNQCASVDVAPLVCTHRCEFAQDCPGGYECAMFGTSKACIPTTSSYTCQ